MMAAKKIAPMTHNLSISEDMQTVQGRRLAAIELTAIMAVTGVNASEAKQAVEGTPHSFSPRRSAAMNTARFFIDAALRRDIESLESMIILPFLIENRLVGHQAEIDSHWIDRLRQLSGQQSQQETIAIIYFTVQTIEEFIGFDEAHKAKIQHLNLTPHDYLVGLVVAVDNVAEPINVFVRQENGVMKVSGLWS
jgi:hypothetical protein